MRVRSFRRIGDPQPYVAEAAVIVVELNDGTPVMLACESGIPNSCIVAHVKDEDFNRLLHGLGFSRMVICDTLDDKLAPPPEGSQLLLKPGVRK